jgi:hypothetical protein
MRLIVCGKSEDGRCIGMPGGVAGYVVFTVMEPVEVTPGDLLSSPIWDEEDAVIPDVVRLKTGEKFPVRIEGAGLALEIARRMVAGGVTWHPPWPGTTAG